MKLEYFSEVKDGKLQPSVSKAIGVDLKHFEGKRVHLVLQKLKSKRSGQQNRLFHMYVGIISKELGYEFEELKDILKYKFLLRERIEERTGEVFNYLGHTSKLNKTEFSELVDGVIRFAAELGIILPLPGENFDINFDNEE